MYKYLERHLEYDDITYANIGLGIFMITLFLWMPFLSYLGVDSKILWQGLFTLPFIVPLIGLLIVWILTPILLIGTPYTSVLDEYKKIGRRVFSVESCKYVVMSGFFPLTYLALYLKSKGDVNE